MSINRKKLFIPLIHTSLCLQRGRSTVNSYERSLLVIQSRNVATQMLTPVTTTDANSMIAFVVIIASYRSF